VPTLEAAQDGRLRYKAILSFVNDIKVVAQTDGIILDILVDEGTAVSKDTIMIQIDNRLAVAEREVASKELESAKLKAEDDSQIKFSVASYEVATSVFNRSQELFAKVVEAQEEWEKKRLEKIKAGFQIDVSKREQLIAQAAVGGDLVASQHTVELGAQALNPTPTGCVVPVGAKFHRNAIEFFKGMAKQHALALGVEGGALQTLAVPSGANFQAAIGWVDVHVGGHARHAFIGQVDDGKGQHAAAGLQVESPLHLAGHGGWGGDGGVPKPP
jgi:hypothetical protein